MYLKARKAVVLTCGGFENNQEMIRNYLPDLPFCYTTGSPYNTGDGISMAQTVGADPWHMNNYAGPSMTLKVRDYKAPFSMSALHYSHEQRGGMIVVGPDAKRFTDEKYTRGMARCKRTGRGPRCLPPARCSWSSIRRSSRAARSTTRSR